jgi:hypothetical protein
LLLYTVFQKSAGFFGRRFGPGHFQRQKYSGTIHWFGTDISISG